MTWIGKNEQENPLSAVHYAKFPVSILDLRARWYICTVIHNEFRILTHLSIIIKVITR